MPPSEEPEDITPDMWRYWELIRSCWNVDPSERPTVQRLLADVDETSTFQTDTSHVPATIDLSVDDREEGDFEMGDGPTLKEPENLTGQVTVDMSDPKFKGNYSWVHLGIYKGKKVSDARLSEFSPTLNLSIRSPSRLSERLENQSLWAR
jgi:hypothetical protein